VRCGGGAGARRLAHAAWSTPSVPKRPSFAVLEKKLQLNIYIYIINIYDM
jgi:hypothetical protein